MTNNHLITGIPRSGTTLLTSLLSNNAVVFSEPDWLKKIRLEAAGAAEFAQCLVKQIHNLRADIENNRPVSMKASRFQTGLPSNYYIREKNGTIVDDKSETPTLIDPELFNSLFVIKSNAQFTACLEELIRKNQFKIFCVIRNPVSAVMSWRSLNIPVSHGNMKIAEKYNSGFVKFIEPAETLLEKQVLIADWFFAQYHNYSEHISIIKYEDLISSPDRVLAGLFNLEIPNIPLMSNKNKSKHYDLSEYNNIKACFENNASSYKKFYEDL